MLSIQLKLPAKLDRASLKSSFSAEGAPGGAVRQVALLWTPHGDRRQTSDIALLWSQTSDEAALGELFSGRTSCCAPSSATSSSSPPAR